MQIFADFRSFAQLSWKLWELDLKYEYKYDQQDKIYML